VLTSGCFSFRGVAQRARMMVPQLQSLDDFLAEPLPTTDFLGEQHGDKSSPESARDRRLAAMEEKFEAERRKSLELERACDLLRSDVEALRSKLQDRRKQSDSDSSGEETSDNPLGAQCFDICKPDSALDGGSDTDSEASEVVWSPERRHSIEMAFDDVSFSLLTAAASGDHTPGLPRPSADLKSQ